MPFTPTGINYIKAESVTDEGTIDRDKFAFIDPSTHAALRRSQIEAGDLLMSMAGVYLGKVAVVPPDVVPANTNQAVAIIRLSSKVDQHFVAYYLRNPQFNIYLNSLVAQSAQPNLNLAEIGNLPVRLPTLDEQRAIAHILGTLDDKIELNRRMNETLEAMARALFKSWFVDFDPVRAKAEGRDTGLPKHIADLFPNSFEDSELGEVPRGWKVGRLGDIAENPKRSVRADRIRPGTPYIALEHMPKRCISLSEWQSSDGLASSKFEFKRGEILFGKLRPYFHKVGVAPVDGVCSTDIVVVAPRTPAWFGFVLGHVSGTEFVEHTNAGSTGTRMPRTSWSEMARYRLAIPPVSVAGLFNEHVRELVAGIIAGIHESRTLARLRDALLPMLISGELLLDPPNRLAGHD